MYYESKHPYIKHKHTPTWKTMNTNEFRNGYSRLLGFFVSGVDSLQWIMMTDIFSQNYEKQKRVRLIFASKAKRLVTIYLSILSGRIVISGWYMWIWYPFVFSVSMHLRKSPRGAPLKLWFLGSWAVENNGFVPFPKTKPLIYRTNSFQHKRGNNLEW
jgi:hypothetical protein